MAARALARRSPRASTGPPSRTTRPTRAPTSRPGCAAVTARGVAVSIDGKPVGRLDARQGRDARVVVAAPATPLTLAPGGHELTLHFVGGPRASDEPLAEIDWAHVGTGEPASRTRRRRAATCVLDATVGGRSLRACRSARPGFVRCSGWIPANATLEVSLATAGGGDADVEARLSRPARARSCSARRTSREAARAGRRGRCRSRASRATARSRRIELVVKRADAGHARAPRRAAASSRRGRCPTATPPAARNVVLVVLGSTSAQVARAVGRPARGARAVARWRRRARRSPRTARRAPWRTPSSASMLTGLPARVHGLDDPDARLPDGPIDGRGGVPAGRRRDGDVHGEPDDGARVRLRPRLGHVRGARSARGRARDARVRRRGGVDRGAQGRPLPRRRARARRPSAVGRDARGAEVDAARGLPRHHRAAARGRGARQGAQAPGPLQGRRPHARLGALRPRGRRARRGARSAARGARATPGREDDTAVIVTGDVAASEAPPVPFVDVERARRAAPRDAARHPLAAGERARRAAASTRRARPSISRARCSTRSASRRPRPSRASTSRPRAGARRRPSSARSRRRAASRFSVRWGPYVLLGRARARDPRLRPVARPDLHRRRPRDHRRSPSSPSSASPSTPCARAGRAARSPAVLDAHTMAALVRWGRLDDDRERGRE